MANAELLYKNMHFKNTFFLITGTFYQNMHKYIQVSTSFTDLSTTSQFDEE